MKKKQVCIMADPIDEQYAGIYTFAKEFITALENYPQDEFEFTYIHMKENDFFKGKEEIIVPLKKWFPGSGSFRKFLYIPHILKKHQFDIVHDLYHIAPFPWKTKKYKNIVTIHDLTPILFPKFHITNSIVVHNIVMPIVMRNVDAVMTVSEATAEDVRKTYCPRGMVRANHIAPKALPSPKKKLLDEPYILFVSTIEPRKGIVTLIKAFEEYRRNGGDRRLVIVGKKGWKCEEEVKAIEDSPSRDDVILCDFVLDQDLATWYAYADLFIYPSVYEGFGLPILEAMRAGVPVIAANNSSIPEVVGDAGILFETGNAKELANNIEKVLKDKKLHSSLVEQGKKHAEEFSWEKTVERTLQLYRELV